MITKDTPIGDVLRQYPAAWEIFVRHGMGCIGCMGAAAETVAGGASRHAIDLETLLDELNRSAGEK